MNKQKLIEALEFELKSVSERLKKVQELEQGRLYEFKWWSSPILGVIKGFSHGVMSCGVKVEVLAINDKGPEKSVTIPIYAGLKVTPVSYSDLPKYIGWKVTKSFEKRLKNISLYIKKEEAQCVK